MSFAQMNLVFPSQICSQSTLTSRTRNGQVFAVCEHLHRICTLECHLVQ